MLSGARARGRTLSARVRAGARGLAVLLGLGPWGGASPAWAGEPGHGAPAPAEAAPEPAPAEAAPEPAPSGPAPASSDAIAGPKAHEAVLGCGLRVIVAQDETLPVAAVVLALETGTEDDPATQPGLVHALAYHLLQGNRELRPTGAAALVHDQGGLASLAVGPAQIRYESLVPISALPDVLGMESQRLRAPTVSAELWKGTLRWARRDPSRGWRAPRAAMAAAHGAPGLEHDGRVVTPGLDEIVPRAVGQAIAERLRYDVATLVVVSPLPPAELHATIEALFADLPAAPRRVRDRSPRWRSGSAPQALPLPSEKGNELVWPVAPDPGRVLEATVWCKALNRQRRHEGEPSRARLGCHLDVDPRRATLVVKATGVDDPVALVRGRLELAPLRAWLGPAASSFC